MADKILNLRIHLPTLRILLSDEAHEVWKEIQFHEGAGQWAEVDKKWERLLYLIEYDILEEVSAQYTVDDADVTHGA